VPAVTRSTTAYAGCAPADPACGITIAGVSAHVKYPAVVVTVVDPVPVTSAAPPVGFNVASAAHRSQNTVPVPYAVLAANETFESVYPYDGFGTIAAAAHAVVDIAYLVVADTLDASTLPPGADVESASTTTEPIACGSAVCDGDGVGRGVPEMDGVAVDVPELVGLSDGVPDTVRLPDGVPLVEGVKVGERV
jgi:hypothetical protein